MDDEFVVDGAIVKGLQVGITFVCNPPINVAWLHDISTNAKPWAVLLRIGVSVKMWYFDDLKNALAFADEFMLYAATLDNATLAGAAHMPLIAWTAHIRDTQSFAPFDWGRANVKPVSFEPIESYLQR